MQIHVALLLKEPVGETRSFNVDDEISLDGDKARLSGHITLTRLDRSILLTGEINARLKQMCSRCVSEFETTVPFRIEEEFFPTIDINTGLPAEKPEEEGAFFINDNHLLDTDDAFRQNLLVALPMKPLCRHDCAGLCTVCGANLNDGECGCNRTPEDARWAELKKLKKLLSTAEKSSSNRKKG